MKNLRTFYWGSVLGLLFFLPTISGCDRTDDARDGCISSCSVGCGERRDDIKCPDNCINSCREIYPNAIDNERELHIAECSYSCGRSYNEETVSPEDARVIAECAEACIPDQENN